MPSIQCHTQKAIGQTILLMLSLLLSVPASAQCVVLLHGLARSNSSMEALESALQQEQFYVVNVDYDSRSHTIDVLAEQAITPALKQCAEHAKTNELILVPAAKGGRDGVSFVTHSMGGILVRQYLRQHTLPNLHRVVMLGPPNKGSEVVDVLGSTPGFHFINGDAGLQLGTGKGSVPNALGPVDFDVGIIAGTRSINWILSSFIPGTDDGKVSVDHTKVDGMNEHLVMPVTHTFMMKNQKVIRQVIHYLLSGHFISS